MKSYLRTKETPTSEVAQVTRWIRNNVPVVSLSTTDYSAKKLELELEMFNVREITVSGHLHERLSRCGVEPGPMTDRRIAARRKLLKEIRQARNCLEDTGDWKGGSIPAHQGRKVGLTRALEHGHDTITQWYYRKGWDTLEMKITQVI